MSPTFKSYLNEIARYPLLTVDQEIQYGRRIARMRELQELERPLTDAEQRLVRSGLRARERFMQCNLQLVVHVAKKYENRKRKSLEIMDLIQEGNIGLARAVELFDSSRGYKFSTYAYWWIRQSVTRFADQLDLIRLPINVSEQLRSAEVDLSDPRLAAAVAARRLSSIDLPIGEGSNTVADMVAADGTDPLEGLDAALLVARMRSAWPDDVALLELAQDHHGPELAVLLDVSRATVHLRLAASRARLREVA